MTATVQIYYRHIMLKVNVLRGLGRHCGIYQRKTLLGHRPILAKQRHHSLGAWMNITTDLQSVMFEKEKEKVLGKPMFEERHEMKFG